MTQPRHGDTHVDWWRWRIAIWLVRHAIDLMPKGDARKEFIDHYNSWTVTCQIQLEVRYPEQDFNWK